MKSIFIVFVSFICLTSTAFSAQKVTILVQNGHFSPYKSNTTDGKVTGIYPEIVKMAVSRMPDYTLEFKELPWARVKLHLKKGLAFAMLPPYFHAHDWLTDRKPKRPYIWPYSLPLVTQYDVVACNTVKMQYPRINWPQDFKDLSFSLVRGDGKVGIKFQRMVDEKIIDVLLVHSGTDALKNVLSGKKDCVVTSKMALDYLISEMKRNGDYDALGKVITLKSRAIGSNEGYLGYTDINADTNYPFKKDFTIKFDIEIYKMKKNGEIRNIIKQFTQ